jgi:hypothetical protein
VIASTIQKSLAAWCAALMIPCFISSEVRAETHSAVIGSHKITSVSREKDKGITVTKQDILDAARNAKPIKPIEIDNDGFPKQR